MAKIYHKANLVITLLDLGNDYDVFRSSDTSAVQLLNFLSHSTFSEFQVRRAATQLSQLCECDCLVG